MSIRSLVFVAVVTSNLLMLGCATVVPNEGSGGSGGNGAGGAGGPSLAVASTSPVDSATGVEPRTEVRASFDAALAPDSVTDDSLRVVGSDGARASGTVELDGDDAIVFIPEKRLSLLTEYTATVDGAVESNDGASLGDDISWAFKVRDGSWRGSQLVGDATDPSTSPVVAIDDDENALVVWEWEPSGSEYSMWANRSVQGLWGEQELLQTSDARGDFDPVIAMDFEGKAFALWEAFQDVANGGITTNLWISTFTRAAGWTAPQRFENTSQDARRPAVEFDPAGNAIAVWMQNGSPLIASLWGSRYDRASDRWDAPRLLETDDSGTTSTPSLAVDAEGNAMALWPQSDGMRFNIWAARYDAASDTWAPPRRVELDNAGNANAEDVAMDGEGNAIAVWSQSDGTINDVWTNRYTRASNLWGTPMRLDIEDAGGAVSPTVGTDAAGNAIAIWPQTEGNRSDMWASHYDRQTDTWSEALRIEEDDTESAGGMALVVDRAGNAVAAWSQGDPGSIWAARFSFEDGWGAPELLETGSDKANLVRLGMSPTGTALAAWRQGTETISNRFD